MLEEDDLGGISRVWPQNFSRSSSRLFLDLVFTFICSCLTAVLIKIENSIFQVFLAPSCATTPIFVSRSPSQIAISQLQDHDLSHLAISTDVKSLHNLSPSSQENFHFSNLVRSFAHRKGLRNTSDFLQLPYHTWTKKKQILQPKRNQKRSMPPRTAASTYSTTSNI